MCRPCSLCHSRPSEELLWPPARRVGEQRAALMSAGFPCSHHVQSMLVCSLTDTATPIQIRPSLQAPSKL